MCHPVRVLRGAFIFGGREDRGEERGRDTRGKDGGKGGKPGHGEARNYSDADPLQRSPRYFISACLSLVPRGKKDRGFESLLANRWTSSRNERINFCTLAGDIGRRFRWLHGLYTG